jgi:hypothetical protein
MPLTVTIAMGVTALSTPCIEATFTPLRAIGTLGD